MGQVELHSAYHSGVLRVLIIQLQCDPLRTILMGIQSWPETMLALVVGGHALQRTLYTETCTT
jgi:hypothetical protein